MFRALLCFLLALLQGYSATLQAQGEGFADVIAKSGLWLRSEPNSESKKILKLPFRKEVELLANTHQAWTVVDNGKTIVGHWVLVSAGLDSLGYVFDGFLLKKERAENEGYEAFCDSEFSPCDTRVSSENYEWIIYNYQSDLIEQIGKDSIEISEYVFNDIGDKLLEIKPKVLMDSVAVFYTFIERVDEFYNSEKIAWEDWEGQEHVSWAGHEDYRRLPMKGNFLRFPVIDYEGQEKRRKMLLSASDTIIDMSGESYNVATMIYKDVPCSYLLEKVAIKIISYPSNGVPDIKEYFIWLSYGC